MTKVTLSTDDVVELTQERVKELFEYLPDTGELKRKVSIPNSRVGKIGMIAGSVSKSHGYIVLGIDGKLYLMHRIIWLFHVGVMPHLPIDHINHSITDNRVENLREVTEQVNQMNRPMPKSNTSGVTGVSFNKRQKNWVSYYYLKKKRVHIGTFKDFNDAVIARIEAIKLAGFHINHGAAV